MGARFWAIFAILALNILGALFLETKMAAFTAELVIIIIGVILSVIVLIGIGTDSKWAWPLSTVFFALSLANLIFLLVSTRAFGTFTVLLLLNVIGLLISVLSIKEEQEFDTDTSPLETYETEPELQVDYGNKPKKAVKRKKK